MAFAWRINSVAAIAVALSFYGLDQAAAQDRLVDEVKVGVLVHDIGITGHHVENGVDINGEILFVSPNFLDVIGGPRPHLGGWVNSAGNTDTAYAGLTWGLPIVKSIVGVNDALTIYGGLGGAVHDGYENGAPAGRKKLGSPVLFRLSAELGYEITPVNSISLALSHMSNAGLASHNAGMTDVGARLGFKF